MTTTPRKRPRSEDLNSRVTAYCGTGEVRAEGVMVAYADRPTVTILTDDGDRITWVADLCEVSPPDPPSLDEIDKLVGQLRRDMSATYWADRPETLHAAEAWLLSLRDHVSVQDRQ